MRLSQRTLDSYPHQQCHGTPQPGDPPPHQSSGLLPGWQFCFDAGLCKAPPCSWHTVGQQEVHEYEALRDLSGGCLYCWLILFCQSLQTILRIILDTTSPSAGHVIHSLPRLGATEQNSGCCCKISDRKLFSHSFQWFSFRPVSAVISQQNLHSFCSIAYIPLFLLPRRFHSYPARC